MKRLNFIEAQSSYLLYCKILFTILLQLIGLMLFAQASYEIRLANEEKSMDNSMICYEVQIRSGTEESWYLAGQNYRLYYDASKVRFHAGEILLGTAYQSFKLVQDLNVDASDSAGDLPFEENLGFLNYSTDLLNAAQAGMLVPGGSEWLSTTKLCFDVIAPPMDNGFCQIWARKEVTEEYATSFTEISSWIGVNTTAPTVGKHYQDILEDCKLPYTFELDLKVALQGAFNPNTNLMNDYLREKRLIPLKEPYTDLNMQKTIRFMGNQIQPELLEITGDSAIVDWILVELRSGKDAKLVEYTKAGLLLRNGQIVEVDGQSPINFNVAYEDYYVSIRHRNHLGVMTKDPINLTEETTQVAIDFTSTTTDVYGQNARIKINDEMLLWGGNADRDAYIVLQGSGVANPDNNKIFFDVFQDEANVNSHYNHIAKGYATSDLNMDGEIRYQGWKNEVDELIFFNVFAHPQNTEFFTNFYIEEQIPRRLN